mmetsp:Transcript_9142/g.41567  ORF Transcript_9142/g.41567 Transcript_9142/m.41567 type:complete len:203 (+) Transcript_9142:330-938(+)
MPRLASSGTPPPAVDIALSSLALSLGEPDPRCATTMTSGRLPLYPRAANRTADAHVRSTALSRAPEPRDSTERSAASRIFASMRPSSVHMDREVTRARAVRYPFGLFCVVAVAAAVSAALSEDAPSSGSVCFTSGASKTSRSTTMIPSVAIRMRSSIARSSLVPLPLPPSLNMVCSRAWPRRWRLPSVPCDLPLRSGVTPSI